MLRRIKTQDEVERKRKRNQLIAGVVLVALLVVGTLGYSFMSEDSDDESAAEENGVKFFRINNLWKASIGDQVFSFRNLPSEVKNVSVEGDYDLNLYVNQPLYFVTPDIGANEILRNLDPFILRYQEACLNGTVCEGDLPEKSCDSNLIIFGDGDASVRRDNNCVYISGGAIGADAFLYKALKIN